MTTLSGAVSPSFFRAQPSNSAKQTSEPLEVFTKFEQTGGKLQEDHGLFRPPFTPRYTEVNAEQAVQLLNDGKRGNLKAQASGEQASFCIDEQKSVNLGEFEAIYLNGDIQKADSPEAANAVRNFVKAGYEFKHQGEPIAAQTAYDHFAHNRFGEQYLAVQNGKARATFHTTHDIGSYDYFRVSGDLNSVQENEKQTALLVTRWEKEDSLMGQDAQGKFEHFTRGVETFFFDQGITLASVQGGGATELERAHDKAMAQRPFVDETIAPQVMGGRMDTEDMDKIYHDVVLKDIPGTNKEERFAAFANLNDSLLKATGKQIKGWSLVEFNRTSLDVYDILAENSQPEKFLQLLGKTSEVLQGLPDFQPATVVAKTLEAADPYLKAKSAEQQAQLITKLSQRLEHLSKWSEVCPDSPKAG